MRSCIPWLLIPMLLSAASATAQPEDHRFALVELFTSEGCSSCPPADRLLQRIGDDAAHANVDVYTLGFHVDYWDRLGWVDRFGKPEFTRRQEGYAGTLAKGRRYTPQVVINGKVEVVGSDDKTIRLEIGYALRRQPDVRLQGRLRRVGPRHLVVEGTTSPLRKAAFLHVALAEEGLRSKVAAGENEGLVLKHASVVRQLVSQAVPALARGAFEATLHVPSWVDQSRSRVVAWIQDRESMAVLGARRWDVPAGGAAPSPPGATR